MTDVPASLADDLRAELAPQGAKPCSVGRWLARCDSDTRDLLTEYIQTIRDWRNEHGLKVGGGPNVARLYAISCKWNAGVGRQAIEDHVKGVCRCVDG